MRESAQTHRFETAFCRTCDPIGGKLGLKGEWHVDERHGTAFQTLSMPETQEISDETDTMDSDGPVHTCSAGTTVMGSGWPAAL